MRVGLMGTLTQARGGLWALRGSWEAWRVFRL